MRFAFRTGSAIDTISLSRSAYMQLFVGLGKLGSKYAQNRQNFGIMELDKIANENGIKPRKKKLNGVIIQGSSG